MRKPKTNTKSQENLPINIDDIDRAPTNLPATRSTNWEEKYHQLRIKFDENADRDFALREEIIELKAKAKTRGLLDELIIPFANKSYKFMIGYCSVVGAMLALHGFNLWFKLADGVLELLVGSTAVTVIGLVGMVLTGVFVGGGKR